MKQQCLFFPRALFVELPNTYVQKHYVHQETNKTTWTNTSFHRAEHALCQNSLRVSVSGKSNVRSSKNQQSSGWCKRMSFFSSQLSYFPSFPLSELSRWGILMLAWYWEASWDLRDQTVFWWENKDLETQAGVGRTLIHILIHRCLVS